METIKYEDFAKVSLKVGTILEVREHPKADKLLVLRVSLGQKADLSNIPETEQAGIHTLRMIPDERQIVAGIKQHYKPEELVGKQIIVVTNLEPRELRGERSEGMLLAASDDKLLSLVTLDRPSVKPGSKVQ